MRCKIREIGTVITGKTPSTTVKDNFDNGSIPFYTPEDVSKGMGMMGHNKRFISEKGYKSIISNSLEGESVLVGCIGTDMGNVAFSNIRCATNQQINSITNFREDVDPLYVYYLLSTKKEYFRDLAGSTTTPILPKSTFEEIELSFPNLKTQKNISFALSLLDRKIELNRQINDNLEAMARQLYDYWFVQFDFPDENGKPYKSSGRKMVWNKEIKRAIPFGWEISPLSELLEVNDARRIPLSNKQRAKRQGIYPYYGATGIMDYVDNFLFDEDLLLLAEDGSTSDGNGHPIVQYIWGKNWVNNHAHILKPKSVGQLYYYYFVLKQIPVALIETGSIQRKISQQNLLSYKVAVPSKNLIQAYSNVANVLQEQRKKNSDEIVSLTKQRNTLLPLLMNGQATVNYHLSIRIKPFEILPYSIFFLNFAKLWQPTPIAKSGIHKTDIQKAKKTWVKPLQHT